MARAGSLAEQLRRLPPGAAVGWFLNAWHGIPALPPPPQPSPIPSLLGQLLVLGRTHPNICGRQNRLIDPVELDDGLLCFYVENQSVYRWAYQWWSSRTLRQPPSCGYQLLQEPRLHEHEELATWRSSNVHVAGEVLETGLAQYRRSPLGRPVGCQHHVVHQAAHDGVVAAVAVGAVASSSVADVCDLARSPVHDTSVPERPRRQ